MIAQTESARRECACMAAAFFFVHDLLRPPSPEQWNHLRLEATKQTFSGLCRLLGLDQETVLPDSANVFESEYIACFDAGAPHPAVPLRESHYNKRAPVTQVLYENGLFYKSFGLVLREPRREAPDHLLRQLEFVGYLYSMEADALNEETFDSVDAEPRRTAQIRRARHEYLQRHLLSWLPQSLELARQSHAAWAAAWIALALGLGEFAGAGSVGTQGAPESNR